jgi:hypothetical protein
MSIYQFSKTGQFSKVGQLSKAGQFSKAGDAISSHYGRSHGCHLAISLPFGNGDDIAAGIYAGS